MEFSIMKTIEVNILVQTADGGTEGGCHQMVHSERSDHLELQTNLGDQSLEELQQSAESWCDRIWSCDT